MKATEFLRMATVHLGFEVGSADPVEIPIRHMAVTGQTQESGKTTALEALITRSRLPAIAFLTKRGESSMHGRQILPYFEDRADWQFVQSILESTMKEKMKFERAWIVRACKSAKCLADVLHRVTRLQEGAKNSLSQDIYMLLGEYLQKVVPLIASLPKIGYVDLAAGLSIMDLTRYPEELQMLVISSTLEWIYRNSEGVIAIIPEAWKFVPQGRNAPVKIVAEKLIREGAGLRNYLWIDSQDMAAVDKMLLRACPVWLIGVQREANEIKRALSNMPAMLKKPKAGDVATLELGQFFACFGKSILKTYVQPAWMNETAGSAIAAGRLDVHSVHPSHTQTPKQPAEAGTRRVESPAGSPAIALDPPVLRTSATEEEVMVSEQAITALRMAIKDGAKQTALQMLDGIFGGETSVQVEPLPAVGFASSNGEPSILSDALYQQILSRLLQDLPDNPRVLQLVASRPEIMVRVQKRTVELDDTTLAGRLAILISEKFFDSKASGHNAWMELEKRGVGSSKPNVYKQLDKLTEMGFLLKLEGGYQSVPGMKVTKNRIESAA